MQLHVKAKGLDASWVIGFQRKRLCAHPVIEYYDCKTMTFVLPLSKQEKFYVPEYYDYENDDDYYRDHKNDKYRSQPTAESSAGVKDHKLVTKNSSSSDKKRH